MRISQEEGYVLPPKFATHPMDN